jgi:hypothetical protein
MMVGPGIIFDDGTKDFIAATSSVDSTTVAAKVRARACAAVPVAIFVHQFAPSSSDSIVGRLEIVVGAVPTKTHEEYEKGKEEKQIDKRG